MKKRTLLIGILLLFILFIGFQKKKAIQAQIPDMSDAITANYCRCHGSSCMGGNLISLRRRCYVSSEATQCHDWDANCTSSTE